MATAEAETSVDATTTEASKNLSSMYAVTDPGMSSATIADDVLENLRNENRKRKPSETSSDDASEPEGRTPTRRTEGKAEKPSEDSESTESDDDFSDELLDRAAALGYELDDLRSFKSSDALEKELKRVENIQKRLQARKPAEPDKAKDEDPDDTDDDDVEPDWDEMIREGYSEEVVKQNKRNWKLGSEAKELRKQVEKLQQAEKLRMVEEHTNRFDDALNELPDEYEEFLGKGRWAELKKTNPDSVKNREQVFTQVQILRNGYKASGMDVPPEKKLIEQAVKALFADQVNTNARKQVRNELKKTGSQGLSRPRSGTDRDIPGDQRAREKEAAFRKKFGL